nr:MAG TPA: hypothetical protein [Caudoviricetes sp.]
MLDLSFLIAIFSHLIIERNFLKGDCYGNFYSDR